MTHVDAIALNAQNHSWKHAKSKIFGFGLCCHQEYLYNGFLFLGAAKKLKYHFCEFEDLFIVKVFF